MKTTITVECEGCHAVFRVTVGWQPYDPNLHARYGKRATLRASGGPQLMGFDDGMEIRVPIRARRCGDHGEGTQGCAGSLRRADRTATRPGGPPAPRI